MKKKYKYKITSSKQYALEQYKMYKLITVSSLVGRVYMGRGAGEMENRRRPYIHYSSITYSCIHISIN